MKKGMLLRLLRRRNNLREPVKAGLGLCDGGNQASGLRFDFECRAFGPLRGGIHALSGQFGGTGSLIQRNRESLDLGLVGFLAGGHFGAQAGDLVLQGGILADKPVADDGRAKDHGQAGVENDLSGTSNGLPGEGIENAREASQHGLGRGFIGSAAVLEDFGDFRQGGDVVGGFHGGKIR